MNGRDILTLQLERIRKGMEERNLMNFSCFRFTPFT